MVLGLSTATLSCIYLSMSIGLPIDMLTVVGRRECQQVHQYMPDVSRVHRLTMSDGSLYHHGMARPQVADGG